MKRAWLLIGLLLAGGCKKPEEKKGPSGPVAVAAADVAAARRAAIESGPRIAGSLEARERAVMRAEVGGSVVAVKAEIGDVVKRGALLARIEDNTLRDALRSAQIGVTSAQADLDAFKKQQERTAKLVEGGALAQRDLEAATTQSTASEARLEAARAQLAQARERLGWANVTSPINGVVSERGVAQGDVVQIGSVLFTVIDPTSMRLKASVSSEQLGAVSIGAPVSFSVRGYPDQSFSGSIERIAPAADEVTRQIPIWISIPNPENKLVAGLFAEGRVSSQAHDALVLPVAAVSLVSTPAQVKRIINGMVEEVSVHVGLRDELAQTIEIIDGVSDGDLVLRGAAAQLVAGTAVQVTGEPQRMEASRPPESSPTRAD